MKFSSFILHPSSLRKGFSLPEIMFAVMILGIGFIMVAAMFPVAIYQAKANKESVTATMVAQRAMQCLQKAGESTTGGASVLPATGGVYSYAQNMADLSTGYPSTFWMSIRGEVIEPSDPRFAWVALYSRADVVPPTAPATHELTANVVVFVTACQETPEYDAAADVGISTTVPKLPPTLFNLQPRLLEANTVTVATNQITFQAATAASFGGPVPADYSTYGALGALGEGGYVLVGNGTAAGRILQITAFDATTNTATMRITDDLTGIAAGTRLWVVGRTFTGSGYQGKVQDIAVYKGVVRVPFQ